MRPACPRRSGMQAHLSKLRGPSPRRPAGKSRPPVPLGPAGPWAMDSRETKAQARLFSSENRSLDPARLAAGQARTTFVSKRHGPGSPMPSFTSRHWRTGPCDSRALQHCGSGRVADLFTSSHRHAVDLLQAVSGYSGRGCVPPELLPRLLSARQVLRQRGPQSRAVALGFAMRPDFQMLDSSSRHRGTSTDLQSLPRAVWGDTLLPSTGPATDNTFRAEKSPEACQRGTGSSGTNDIVREARVSVTATDGARPGSSRD
jgi:hypothetical protein